MSDSLVPVNPPRFLRPGLAWLGPCNPSMMSGRGWHVHHSVFLILGEDATVLVDTAYPSHWPALEAHLEQLLGDRPLDWVYPTHPEFPHAASLPSVLAKYPECRVVGDVRDLHVFHPEFSDRLVHKRVDETLTIGPDHELVFIDAPFKDLPSTLWLYDRKQRAMFVSDGFAYTHYGTQPNSDELIHAEGECRLTSSELPGTVQADQATFMMITALAWLQYRDREPVFAEVARLLDAYPSDLIAPAHGNVIDNVDQIIPILKEAYR